MSANEELSSALRSLRSGVEYSIDDLMPLVFGDLHRLAGHHLRREAVNHTLQATALVNEVYMKFRRSPVVGWEGRTHFFATAARVMRQVLVDHARTANREKRGGGWRRQELMPDVEGDLPELDLLALDEALAALGEEDPRKLEVVELRFFVGLTTSEAAEVLGISSRTVERDWVFAQAWLARRMQ